MLLTELRDNHLSRSRALTSCYINNIPVESFIVLLCHIVLNICDTSFEFFIINSSKQQHALTRYQESQSSTLIGNKKTNNNKKANHVQKILRQQIVNLNTWKIIIQETSHLPTILHHQFARIMTKNKNIKDINLEIINSKSKTHDTSYLQIANQIKTLV